MLRPRPIRSSQPPAILMKIINHSALIGILFFILAVIYTFLIISGEIGEYTKIQENALLAGLVDERWHNTNKLTKLLGNLGKIKNKQSDIRKFIFDEFVKMRVEVFRQQFKILPSSFTSNNSKTNGENIYGIIRAFRASPVEAILLAVPTNSIESIAVALAFADYAKDQLYWARDLVFLFVDGGTTQSADIWLSAYHGQQKEGIEFIDDELPAHGGTFIGAFGLEIKGNVFENVEILHGMVSD
uniref:VWFA domain-containing protein n=1 Tax=Meloidogyne hapla TaxID=6305 RepID=A0A1I8C028_MELHA